MFAQCFPLYQIPCFNLVRQEINGALILGSIWFWLKLRKLEAYGTFMASAFKFFMNPTSIRKRIRCGWEELYIYAVWSSIFIWQNTLFWLPDLFCMICPCYKCVFVAPSANLQLRLVACQVVGKSRSVILTRSLKGMLPHHSFAAVCHVFFLKSFCWHCFLMAGDEVDVT